MSLLMDALRKAEESKQRNASQSADLVTQESDNQPLTDHVDATSPATQAVDETEHSIDVQQYSHVQSSEDCLKAQQWSMLFDKPVLNKTAWVNSSDLDEEAKTLIEWDDRLAETLLSSRSSVDTHTEHTPDTVDLPPAAAESTETAQAPSLDFSGLDDETEASDSVDDDVSDETASSPDFANTRATPDAPFLDLSGLTLANEHTQPATRDSLALDSDNTPALPPAHDISSDDTNDDTPHLDLGGLEDIDDAETTDFNSNISSASETPYWEKSLLEEAESLSGNEAAMLALENELADIDPNELDWALETDALDKNETDIEITESLEAESKAHAEPDVDWSAVSIETLENTEHHASLDDITEFTEPAEPVEAGVSLDNSEPALPVLDLELPDTEPANETRVTEVPSLDLTLPEPAVATKTETSEPAPMLDLDLGFADATPTETAQSSAATVNTESDLDWGDMLSETDQAISSQPARRAWDNVKSDDNEEVATAKQGLELNWDDELLPLPENVAAAAAQTEAQKQQAAQDLLKAAKRRQRHTAKFNAYGLVGLVSIAALGLVLLYTLEQDPSESSANNTGNQSEQLSTVDSSGLPSPKIETVPDTTKSAKPPVEKQKPETTPPAPDSGIVAGDAPKTPEKAVNNSDNTTEKVLEKIATGIITLPEKITGKITEPLGGNTPNKKPPIENTGQNNIAVAPPKPSEPTVAEKVPSYPNTSLRQNMPNVPEVAVQKSHSNQDRLAVQRDAQREQRAQQLNANLNQAYQAFQNRQWTQAQRLYQTALQQDAYNRDALLGLASIALAHSNPVQAQQYYKTVLKHHPQDQTARLGLLSTTANAQPAQGERELRSLLNESNVDKGYVYFSLGNLYISQRRWSAAQQAFFDAWRQDKQQPNYAYNLAVSLEHLNQPAAAIQYYQQALQLAQRNPNQPPNFNLQTVQQRVQTLAAHVPSQQGNLTQLLGQ